MWYVAVTDNSFWISRKNSLEQKVAYTEDFLALYIELSFIRRENNLELRTILFQQR